MKFKLPVDVCTPAGVAKMLIKDSNKLSSKDLKQGRCNPVFLLLTLICVSTLLPYQINHLCSVFLNYIHACLFSVGATFTSAMSSGSMIARQNKQIKEALFMKKVQQDTKEEQTNHLKW